LDVNEDQERALETNLARDRAEALAEALRKAKAESEADPERLSQLTPEQIVEGRTAMDSAIASAERMIEALNAALEIARKEVEAKNEEG
jgi:hypothetical protein